VRFQGYHHFSNPEEICDGYTLTPDEWRAAQLALPESPVSDPQPDAVEEDEQRRRFLAAQRRVPETRP
jgi:hypothetical protein